MIRFDHVSKKYPGTTRPALDDITLEVLRGEFVFLVGASGSGKSSCLRLILKEEKPSGGSMHVLGQNLGSISNRKVPYFRRNIGVVFQDFRLLPNKTVFQNVAFTLQVIGKSRGFIQEAVPDVLGMVGLTGKEQRLPHELSGGEQQRVAIARAVVNKPQVLLADEPTGNLDPVTSAGIMAVLERINAGGTTVVMATHEAGIVDQMQRRVVELVNGEIVRDERHGGYTTAIPVQRPTDALAAVERAAAAAASVALAPAPDSEPAVAGWAVAESAEYPVAAAEPEPELTPEPEPEPEQTAEPELAFVMESAEASVAEPAATASVPKSPPPAAQNAHFAGPLTHPVLPQHTLTDDDLSEQLSLAERLGLRPAKADRDDDAQNVGPVQ